MGRTERPRLGLFAWCLYDWANSAFPTLITTFVFAAYFAQAVAPDPVSGTALWGKAIALAGLVIAVLSPVLGAIADRSGRRKPWIFGFSLATIVASALLWRVVPGAVAEGLLLVALATAAFELAQVFYNAMLPDLVAKDRLGRLSGWAWGLGYCGGLACLALALVGFVQAKQPWFGLDKNALEHIRVVGPLVAVWFLIFSLPLFFWTPDRESRGLGARRAVREGLGQLAASLRTLRWNGPAARFLLAHMIYSDGIVTLFAFGGIYAAGSFGFAMDEIILFGIAINVTAGIGAFGFAWLDDRLGAKAVILIGLVGLIGLGGALLVAEGKAAFWALALPLGLFVGPVQAASRSMMARLAPSETATEMFGLFALSGKATSFLGPAILAWVTEALAGQRAGMATILIFLGLGLALLLGVADPQRFSKPPGS